MTSDALTLADRFRNHAGRAENLYAVLLRAMADDWDAGGVVRTICTGWENAPVGALVQLRLLAGVHRLVLTGRAPGLVPYYPNLGGTADPAGAWPVFQQVLAAHVEQLEQSLQVAPQTNEPGRSTALLVGLFEAVRRSGLDRVRLLEPGASAGLNLLVDQFRIGGDGWWAGPADSPLVLADAVHGAVEPVAYQIVERRGCDLEPVDATTDEGRLRLTSFVWPYQTQRHDRLRAALQIAASHPIDIDQLSAGDWLAEQLSVPPEPGVLTVVWHSVTRLYWPPSETDRVERIITEAGVRMPLAHIAMEYPQAESGQPAELSVQVHLPGEPDDSAVLATVERQGGPVVLATVADHGVPIRSLRA